MEVPNRRHSITDCVWINGGRHHLTASYHPETGAVFEVWCYGPKPGSERDLFVQDSRKALSHEMQDGDPLSAIAARTMRHPDGAPVSIRGTLTDFAMGIRNDLLSGREPFDKRHGRTPS